jgi:hypothetical protein
VLTADGVASAASPPVDAYNFARRLETLRGLILYALVRKAGSDAILFRVDAASSVAAQLAHFGYCRAKDKVVNSRRKRALRGEVESSGFSTAIFFHLKPARGARPHWRQTNLLEQAVEKPSTHGRDPGRDGIRGNPERNRTAAEIVSWYFPRRQFLRHTGRR